MNRARVHGMTLIELLVVILILGSLLALVAPNVIRSLKRSQVGVAKAQMARLGEAVTMYRLEKKHLPQTLAVLTEEDPTLGEAYLDRIPDDPWGAPYGYRVLTRKKYEIHSNGDDGQPDTEDDLRHPVLIDD